MAQRKKKLTLEEALLLFDELDSDDVDDIYIEPPDAADITDEDSAEEDEGGLTDNLSGRQLRANVEISKKRNRNYFDSDSDDGIDSNKSIIEKRTKAVKNKKACTSKKIPRKWTCDEIKTANTMFPEPDFTIYREKSPLQIFEMFFDEEIVSFLVDESSRYALLTNNPDPKIETNEMKVFIGILILSGYNTVPGKKRYWENSLDLRNDLVYNAMRRDRFIQIMKYIHCADNTKIDMNDKMYKLRPLMDKLKKRFLENWKAEQCLNYDESMIPYFGKHSCKQFIKGKPIRFGYKAWCLNTPEGYLINFDVYQGRSPYSNDQYEEEFGKSAAPLVIMVDELPENVKELPFRFYFDNLFTGFNLIKHLQDRGYGSSGTIRENRVPKDCPLPSSKDMRKRKRGEFETSTSIRENITVVRWVDNSVVTVASSCHGTYPLTYVNRFSRTEKKKIKVQRPAVIGEYNSFMGGTDRMDENISLYRIGIRGKKWWWSIFTWLIDVSVHNSWLLSRKTGNDITQLEFKRYIVQTYLQRYKNVPRSGGRVPVAQGSSIGARISDDLRLDMLNHFIQCTTERRRCAAVNCTSRVRTECKKCNVGLCVNCFVNFHTKP